MSKKHSPHRMFPLQATLQIILVFLSAFFAINAFAQELSSLEFAKAMKVIAAHGDMEDISFAARSLGLKLKPAQNDAVGQNYTIEGADSPLDVYYRIGPKRPEIGNRRSAMLSINIDRKRYCLTISDVYSIFGPPLPDIPVHIRYGSKAEEIRAEREKKHHRYALRYELVGETNVLSVYFTFAYQDCARDVSIAQNQDVALLPPTKTDVPAPAN